jgi:hypothetical protein
MPFRRRPDSAARALFVISVFVGHIPIRQNNDSGRQSLPLPSLFRIADFKVDVVTISELCVKGTLKPVGPLGVILNNLLKVVEELAVRVYTRNLDVGAGVLNEIALKEWNGLQTL